LCYKRIAGAFIAEKLLERNASAGCKSDLLLKGSFSACITGGQNWVYA
jgi:hypothetical protein